MSVLVLGALHLDVVVDAPRLPRVGETLMGSAVDYRFGGKGGNQAVAAARMGARVHMAGRVGRDRFGAEVEAALDRAGVERSRVLRVDAPTGMSVAITEAAGEYGAVVVSGANLENDGVVEVPAGVRVCVMQNEIPAAANAALAAALPSGVTLVHNAAPARAGAGLSPGILVVNEIEASDMTGLADPEAAARALREGAGAVIVTLGARGLILCDDAVEAMPAAAARVVSAHGAGDMFVGALAAEIARGAALRAAARFAQRAAGVFVGLEIAAREGMGRERVAGP
ncbi:PfkB family carbohydrate kinase [Ovoidimarina sediminis]|uniref:PfkB family carbohydrate kinase n=1 Tax=Ovoidimarina sediminis TaxID=3079856 RepID=UPI00290F0C66|nr:PfkB family carbohydrate kinase [Rhodophyticola sp. MJ-SS7]MDU8942739.1 PfkB family carbohydrate kinase [Rhodophyticola sp. MJ-SS7]